MLRSRPRGRPGKAAWDSNLRAFVDAFKGARQRLAGRTRKRPRKRVVHLRIRNGMSSGSLRPPAPLFTAACCASAGILLADQTASLFKLGLVLLAAALAYALAAPGRQAWLALLLLGAGVAHHWTRERSPSRELSRRLPPGDARPVVLSGTVRDVPQLLSPQSGPPRCKFTFRIHDAGDGGFALPGGTVLVHSKGEVPRCGERLRIRLAIRRIPHARNPGQPDLADLWARRGVWVEGFVTHPHNIERLAAPRFWQPHQWAASCRVWISDALARGIENRPLEHSLIGSMMLGVRADGLRDAEAWFRETGTMHLFAVSGLNLTMLAWLFTSGFRAAGAGPRLTALLTVPLLVFYAFSVGLGPSCMRALMGAVLFLGCAWVERPSVACNNIGAAALVLLLADTNNLFHGGFQLSFCLVLALLWVAIPWGRSLSRRLEPDPLLPRKLWSARQHTRVRLSGSLCGAFAASLVAFAGGLPWCFLVFHLVSPVGVWVNLVVIPLAFGILSLGLLSLCATPLGPVSPWVNRANALLARLLLHTVRIGSSIPGASWAVANPFEKRPDFVVFDAGNGAAVLLDPAGEPWLLDCGSAEQYPSLLLPGLRFFGVNRLAGLVLSHGDAAHIGGAFSVQSTFRPAQLVEPPAGDRSRTRKKLSLKLAEAGTAARPVAAGERLQDAPLAAVEVLYPPRGVEAALADDKGLVVLFRAPRWSLLYTADAGFPTERWLLEHAADRLRADVWVRGRHSREVTGTDAFVSAVNPSIIVVSEALFGRDSEAERRWAEHWRARGKSVWLQPDTGAVQGWAAGDRRVRGYLSGEEMRW